MNERKIENEKWLDAHFDPVAGLYTFTQCICFSDISADGDNKLIIADLGSTGNEMKLKVYKGTSIMTENTIIDLPTGVVTFYMDTHEPRTPAIAVASGPYIYVYKNLRPYFRFTLPTMDINSKEQDLWDQHKQNLIDVMTLREMLENMRSEGCTLSVRSLKFLQLAAHDLHPFADLYKNSPLKRQTVITCLDTLKKSMSEEDAISCLVLGTESKQVYVLDPEAFTVLSVMELPSVPVFLSVTGLFDVEFRIVVSCRNGGVYNLKRGDKMGKICFELNSQPVGMARLSKTIVVGTMDENLQCYTTKGKKLWQTKLPAAVTTLEVLDNTQKGYKAIMVGLANSEVHIYRDKYLVDKVRCEDIVTGMKFGRFGREDACLVMTTKGGGLIVKMLKRTASMEEKDHVSGPPASQSMKLNVPKKTKLFVDQTLRERENAVSMHRQFQHDLYRLRLDTARNYLNALQTSMNPISSNPQEPLKVNAHVNGIGPMFKMVVDIQNTSLSQPSMDLMVTFQYDEKLYKVYKSVIHVPMLVPGLNYSFESYVECLNDKGISDNIRVFVLKRNRSVPLITAVISMPVSEAVVVV